MKARPKRLAVIAAMLAVAAALGGDALAEDTRPEEDAPSREGELRLASETVARGEYRVAGQGTVELGAEEALAILITVDEHCADGCRWPISSLDRIEILEEHDDRMITWSLVDDVMDASYFQVASVTRNGGIIELVVEIPGAEEIARLESAERAHEPFFHRQRTTWRLAEEPGGGTRVEVEMEMASERFLVNLMPRRVLEGAESSLGEYFAHLATAESAASEAGVSRD